jgi:hypothetical protein
MNAYLLEFLAYTALIATFVGPILFIWRLRSVTGLLCGIVWFWLFLILWLSLADAAEVANHHLYHPGVRLHPDYGRIYFLLLIAGFPFGLIYNILLSLPIAIQGTLKEIKAKSKHK